MNHHKVAADPQHDKHIHEYSKKIFLSIVIGTVAFFLSALYIFI